MTPAYLEEAAAHVEEVLLQGGLLSPRAGASLAGDICCYLELRHPEGPQLVQLAASLLCHRGGAAGTLRLGIEALLRQMGPRSYGWRLPGPGPRSYGWRLPDLLPRHQTSGWIRVELLPNGTWQWVSELHAGTVASAGHAFIAAAADYPRRDDGGRSR